MSRVKEHWQVYAKVLNAMGKIERFEDIKAWTKAIYSPESGVTGTESRKRG